MVKDLYAHGHAPAVLKSHSSRTVDNSAAYLKPYLEPNKLVLDVGCGPGTISADIAEIVYPSKVIAIDNAPEVLKDAETFTEDRKLTNLEFKVGDVYKLDFEDNTFDIAHAHQVMQHLSDPVTALKEMARVVKPGGIIAARDADFGAVSWYPHDERLEKWISVLSKTSRHNKAEPCGGRHLLAWANKAGFSQVVASASVWCYADPESRTWLGNMWAERMTDTRIAEQALDYGVATPEDLKDIAEGFQSWLENEDGWLIIPCGEILAWV